MENFGGRLRAVRQSKKMTIGELARLCGSTEVVIRGYEKSRRMPNVEMMIRICNVLKVAPDFLLQDELSFQPYKEKGELFDKINKLSPEQFQFLIGFLELLEEQS